MFCIILTYTGYGYSHFIQHLVLDDDGCNSQNIGGIEINLVKSNDLYFS